MKNERTKNATRNIIWGFFQRMIGMILPFISRTVMIYTLGNMYLGLNGLFSSVLQVLNVSELGISSAITFSMYKPLAEGDEEEVCALMNFYKKCYRIIGFVVLVAGLLLLPMLRKLISGDVPTEINIYILYLIQLAATFISYQLFSYKSALLNAAQRNDITSKVSSVIAVIQTFLQIFVLLFLKNYYIYILVVLVSNVINNLTVQRLSKKLFPQYISRGKISKEQFKEIRTKVGGMIFQKIGGVILSSVDTIIISAFLGLTTLGLYQNYYYIITSLFGILGVIMSALISTVGNSIVTESVEKNYRDFKKFNFIYIWIVTWCTICLLCVYQPFMELWVGKERMLSFEMVILFAIYFFVHKWCDMLYVYQEACGIWWETKMVPLCAAIVNLCTNIVLVMIIGLPGILISTIVSVVFVYDIGYAKVLFKVYFKGKGKLKEYIARQGIYLISVVFVSIITFGFCEFIQGGAFIQIIGRGIICIVVPNVILMGLWCKLPEYTEAKKQIVRIVGNYIVKRNKG